MTLKYGIGIVIFFSLAAVSLVYKRQLRKKMNSKYKCLKVLFGLSMIIVDIFPKRLWKNNLHLNRAFKELKVKENIEKEKYEYAVEKVSISLVILLGSLVIGLGCSLNEGQIKKISSLTRKKDVIAEYSFVAMDQKGNKKDVSIEVQKKELTQKEKEKAIEKSKKLLIKKVLGKNKSTDYISSDLKFVNKIGSHDIDVSWSISDKEIIDYDGRIADDVPKEGVIVTITATLMLDDMKEDYIFPVHIYPKKDYDVEASLQNYVDNNEKGNVKVDLPAKIGNKVYSYIERKDNFAIWIFPMGIIISIAIYFLKDKDLDSKLDNRKRQMIKDYPEIVSKILVFYSAGLSMKSSFARISTIYRNQKKDKDNFFRYAYEEIEIAEKKMNSGISEVKAISEFGQRSGIHSYIKLANIIEQNVKRGSNNMIVALKEELNNATMEKKNTVLKEGTEIATKLLGPMILMLIISIVIIMAPALLSIKI